jgi:hypothetical protein
MVIAPGLNASAPLAVFGAYVLLNAVCVLGPLSISPGPVPFLLALAAFWFVGPPVAILGLVVVQLCFTPRASQWVLVTILALAVVALAAVNLYVLVAVTMSV